MLEMQIMPAGEVRTIDIADACATRGHCIIDIVLVLVRVSCPTETQTDRPRQIDGDRPTETETDRPRPRQTKTETDRPRQTIDIVRVSCSTQPDRLTDRDRHTETEPSVKGLMTLLHA